MNREELMLAFRMIAMGRPAVPQVEALVDYLLGLAPVVPVVDVAPAVLEVEIPDAQPDAAPKRGRKPKAD